MKHKIGLPPSNVENKPSNKKRPQTIFYWNLEPDSSGLGVDLVVRRKNGTKNYVMSFYDAEKPRIYKQALSSDFSLIRDEEWFLNVTNPLSDNDAYNAFYELLRGVCE